MRSQQRRKQDIWFVTREKDDSNIEPFFVYGKPIKKRMSVSSTSGSVFRDQYGVIQTYDRYLVTYEHDFKPSEGTWLYVDKTPELDANKDLMLTESNEPTVRPDYVIDRVFWTQKGTKTRIGIKRIPDGGDLDG